MHIVRLRLKEKAVCVRALDPLIVTDLLIFQDTWSNLTKPLYSLSRGLKLLLIIYLIKELISLRLMIIEAQLATMLKSPDRVFRAGNRAQGSGHVYRSMFRGLYCFSFRSVVPLLYFIGWELGVSNLRRTLTTRSGQRNTLAHVCAPISRTQLGR